MVRRLQSLLVDFVWNGRKHWLRSAIVTAPINEGGLGLVDLATKIRAFRFLAAQRLLLDKDISPWRALALQRMEAISGTDNAYALLSGAKTINPDQTRDHYYFSLLESWKSFDVQPLADTEKSQGGAQKIS